MKSRELSISIAAPTNVVVTVVDAFTGKPIAGATVTSNTGMTKTTGSDGTASFPVIVDGQTNYFFTASAPGYLSNTGYSPPGSGLPVTIRLTPVAQYPYGLPETVTCTVAGQTVTAKLIPSQEAAAIYGVDRGGGLPALYYCGTFPMGTTVTAVQGYYYWSTTQTQDGKLYVNPDDLRYPPYAP